MPMRKFVPGCLADRCGHLPLTDWEIEPDELQDSTHAGKAFVHVKYVFIFDGDRVRLISNAVENEAILLLPPPRNLLEAAETRPFMAKGVVGKMVGLDSLRVVSGRKPTTTDARAEDVAAISNDVDEPAVGKIVPEDGDKREKAVVGFDVPRDPGALQVAQDRSSVREDPVSRSCAENRSARVIRSQAEKIGLGFVTTPATGCLVEEAAEECRP